MRSPLERLKDLPFRWICMGKPLCPFGDDLARAEQNMKDGCPLCQRTAVYPNGAVTDYRLPTH